MKFWYRLSILLILIAALSIVLNGYLGNKNHQLSGANKCLLFENSILRRCLVLLSKTPSVTQDNSAQLVLDLDYYHPPASTLKI